MTKASQELYTQNYLVERQQWLPSYCSFPPPLISRQIWIYQFTKQKPLQELAGDDIHDAKPTLHIYIILFLNSCFMCFFFQMQQSQWATEGLSAKQWLHLIFQTHSPSCYTWGWPAQVMNWPHLSPTQPAARLQPGSHLCLILPLQKYFNHEATYGELDRAKEKSIQRWSSTSS